MRNYPAPGRRGNEAEDAAVTDLDYSLPKEHHLRRPADFRKVFDRKRSVSDAWLIVYGCENGLPHNRLGLSVSRKHGPAVYRNRLRRLYREAFRLTRHELPAGYDLILIPRTSAEPDLETLRRSLPQLVVTLTKRLEREATRP
jgi:ribonuclease P protein component